MGGRGGSGGGPAIGEVKRWSVADVGKLQSGNEHGMTVEQEYQRKEVQGRYTENDYIRAKQDGFASPRAYQASITDHIAKHGMINAAQWGREDKSLVEGYHRYAAMRQLGKKTMKMKRSY